MRFKFLSVLAAGLLLAACSSTPEDTAGSTAMTNRASFDIPILQRDNFVPPECVHCSLHSKCTSGASLRMHDRTRVAHAFRSQFPESSENS